MTIFVPAKNKTIISEPEINEGVIRTCGKGHDAEDKQHKQTDVNGIAECRGITVFLGGSGETLQYRGAEDQSGDEYDDEAEADPRPFKQCDKGQISASAGTVNAEHCRQDFSHPGEGLRAENYPTETEGRYRVEMAGCRMLFHPFSV